MRMTSVGVSGAGKAAGGVGAAVDMNGCKA
jgi:hypothetical protein